MSCSFAHLPHVGLTMGKTSLAPVRSRLCRMHISETAGQIYPIPSSMELSRSVAVQRHSNLPIYHLWTCPWVNQIPLGSRFCGTHISETTGWIYTIWSSMELSQPVVVQHHGHITLTLDFQGQILKSHIKRTGRPIDMEQKECQMIWSGTHFVALNFDLSHDLDLEFSRSNFEQLYFRNVWID